MRNRHFVSPILYLPPLLAVILMIPWNAVLAERAQRETDQGSSVQAKTTNAAAASKAAKAATANAASTASHGTGRLRSVTNEQRKAVAQRAAARRRAQAVVTVQGTQQATTTTALAGPKALTAKTTAMATMTSSMSGSMPMNMTPDYFGMTPNYANSPFPQRACSASPTTSCYSDADCGITGGSCSVVTGGGIRKFVDTLPGLGSANQNNLGQFIPVANPIKNPDGSDKYAGSDYYELAVVDATQQFHSDLPSTTQIRSYADLNGDGKAHYLGPLIIAQRNRPTRIKFTNSLAANSSFFLPVDTTVMGAGMGPNNATDMYSANRAELHLHGGDNPWISDGTPHQWVTPTGESTPYKKGVSFQNVPDMIGAGKAVASPADDDATATYFYPNGQSGRLMFYHDHSYGITRLNVYAGEAAGYLLTDPVEDTLIDKGVIPGAPKGDVYRYGIPLIIQDKTFVPDSTTLQKQDPTWMWGATGNFWFPHVYMPNQWPDNPDLSGVNPMGRWDYGPWFWPPMDPSMLLGKPVVGDGTNGCPAGVTCPGTPNPSIVPEAFMDTPIVNGTAYPVLKVARKAYRFRILNAANDRTLNLQLYYALDAATNTVCKGTGLPSTPQTGQIAGCSEVKFVPDPAGIAGQGPIPDPTTAGPNMIQIGTEGGLLPAPVVLPNTPINYVYNRRDIVVLNVSDKTLMLGPAERADIIVDFSQVPDGSTILLYNDSPAPVPAFDTRYDYYTGDPDQTDMGGAPTTLPGYGPNTRTIMQFQVSGSTADPALDLTKLQNAFKTTVDPNTGVINQGAFAASQPAPIVPEAAFGPAYNQTYSNTYSRIQSTQLTFTPVNADGTPTGAPITQPIIRKAIQELFDPDYGRMNAILGVEMPMTNFTTQTTIPYYYIDPPTEVVKKGETQIWKITHNGVDTHAIHFHLFNVQLINRVGWDGAVRPPDPNEVGWKETVRMNPLEDAIVAIKPIHPQVPWPLPDNVRPLDVTSPKDSTVDVTGRAINFTNVDPNNQPVVTVNKDTNFGWEYVWHCHLLGHEENDMMRAVVYQVPPETPSNLVATPPVTQGAGVTLTWADNSVSESGFTVQEAKDPNFTTISNSYSVGPNNGYGGTVQFIDADAPKNGTTYYRVASFSPNGTSAWSNVAQVVTGVPVAQSQTLKTNVNTPLNITLVGTDADGDTLTYIVTSQPAHGTLSGTAPNVTYTPNNNYYGADSFTFKVNDGFQDSNVATVTINVVPVPTIVSVTPNSGTGSSQTFTYVITNPAGYSAMSYVQGIFNTSISYTNGCSFNYDVATNTLRLNSDAGGWLAPLVAGLPATQSNSQCTLDAGASSATGSGNTLTLKVALTFVSYTGVRNIYAFAADPAANTGWKLMGTWGTAPVIINQPPTVDSMTPNGATGATQNLTFQFSSVNGYAYVTSGQIIINNSISYTNDCAVNFNSQTKVLQLMNDAGSTWGPAATIGVPGTLQNSKCIIDAGNSAISGSGNALQLKLAITAKPVFLGSQAVYAIAFDKDGRKSSWVQIGTWTPNVPVATPPSIVSVTKTSNIVSFTVSDVNGSGFINTMQAMIGTSLGYASSCSVYYFPGTNLLYLMNDAGTSWGTGKTIGQPGTLSNSQCTINTAATTKTTSVNNLSLNLSVTFTPAFVGNRNAWALAVDSAGKSSGWVYLGPFIVN